MNAAFSVRRAWFISRKEIFHLIRDPTTLFLALFMPFLQLTIIGFAIDTNIRHIRTVVLDQANTEESRILIRKFENTQTFHVVGQVTTDEEMTRAIVSGRARVGIKIPENYSKRILAHDTAQLLLVVDGSESATAGEAVNVGSLLVNEEALQRVLASGHQPIAFCPEVLFNPDARSPNFLLPGLMVILSQIMAVMLTANSIVREKEQGTLEQLFMTPVKPSELIPGKLFPYLALTLLEFCGIVFLVRFLFQVPVHGYFITLLTMALPFTLTMLGVGLWISTRVRTRDASLEASMATVVPSIFLSGYIFPLDSMPVVFQFLARLIPTTWMIDASRGVILRGAGWQDLWINAVVLWGMAFFFLGVSIFLFRKRLT